MRSNRLHELSSPKRWPSNGESMKASSELPSWRSAKCCNGHKRQQQQRRQRRLGPTPPTQALLLPQLPQLTTSWWYHSFAGWQQSHGLCAGGRRWSYSTSSSKPRSVSVRPQAPASQAAHMGLYRVFVRVLHRALSNTPDVAGIDLQNLYMCAVTVDDCVANVHTT